jgi:uncharacterized protein (DUF2249 family)
MQVNADWECPESLTHVKARAKTPGEHSSITTAMSPPTFKRLDARKLLAEGIEPFPAIRKRVDALKEGEGLAVIAPFLPSPLIEKLRSENFSSRVEPQPDGGWVTYFWRETPEG